MTTLDAIALALLVFLVALILVFIVFLGGLPGRIAEREGHPQARAIRIGGWATLLMAGVGWPFVLMWAYMARPSRCGDASARGEIDDNGELRTRLNDLGERLHRLENGSSQPRPGGDDK